MGRRVQHRQVALRNAKLGSGLLPETLGRVDEDVVARVAVLQQLVGCRKCAFQDLGRVLARREVVVPQVDPVEETPEVHPVRSDRMMLNVETNELQRGAVLGLEVDLLVTLVPVRRVVDVVHKELCALKEPLAGLGATFDELKPAMLASILGVAWIDDPHRLDRRCVGRQRLGNRLGVTSRQATPHRREHRHVFIEWSRPAQLFNGWTDLFHELVLVPAAPNFLLIDQLQRLKSTEVAADDQLVLQPLVSRRVRGNAGQVSIEQSGSFQEELRSKFGGKALFALGQHRHDVIGRTLPDHRQPWMKLGFRLEPFQSRVELLEELKVSGIG